MTIDTNQKHLKDFWNKIVFQTSNKVRIILIELLFKICLKWGTYIWV